MIFRRIFLIGPRGSGKSSVARLLATQLGWRMLDADVVLEQQAGQSIRSIFQYEGEAGFRDRESVVLAQLCQQEQVVIATGGGVILRPENRQILRASGAVVWLTADARTLWQRISEDATTAERRPNLGGGGQSEVEQILASREPLYRTAAHHIVDTTGRTPEQVADLVSTWLVQSAPRQE